MTPKQKQRALIVAGIALSAFVSIGFLIYASKSELSFYYSPSEVLEGKAPLTKTIRVGGLVLPGTLIKSEDSLEVKFDVIDGKGKIHVQYDGILPDLFREGQGIIAKGVLDESNTFTAIEILAKHDEEYMPPEVADSLKKTGHPSSIPITSNSK